MSGRHRYRLSGLLFESDADLPELTPAAGGEAGEVETRVAWHDARPRPSAPSPCFSKWMTAQDEEWLTFVDIPGGFLLTFPELGQFEVSTDASRIDAYPFPEAPPETMRHLFLNQIVPLALSRRGRIVLHASAVSYRDQVVAFIGRSGAGKSTLAVACAHRGASIVSDDCLVVYPKDDRWMAVPCHAGVRLWPDALALLGRGAESGEATAHYSDKRRLDAANGNLAFETRDLPLVGILHMRPPSPEDRGSEGFAHAPVTRVPEPGVLRGRDAVMALASEIFRIDWRDAAESRRQFDAIGAMGRTIPVEIPERRPPDELARALLCRMSQGWRLP